MMDIRQRIHKAIYDCLAIQGAAAVTGQTLNAHFIRDDPFFGQFENVNIELALGGRDIYLITGRLSTPQVHITYRPIEIDGQED